MYKRMGDGMMNYGRFLARGWGVLCLLLLLGPVSAFAAEVFVAEYGEGLPRGGRHSYSRGQLRLNNTSGSIEFWIQHRGAERVRVDPVFSFRDPKGDDFLLVSVLWGGPGRPASIGFDRSSRARYRYKYDVWGSGFTLGDMPAAGEWVHVVLTYGPNRAFVNGEEVTSFWPRPGNTGTLNFGRASGMVVGKEAEEKGKSTWVTEDTLIGGVAIHDSAVSTPEAAALYASRTGTAPEIAALSHDASGVAGFSGRLVAGDTVTVTMEGTPGQKAAFDVARLADLRSGIPVSWKGWGVYLEDITFFEEDQVNLRDVEEYRVYASREPIDVRALTEESPFLADLEVEEQSYVVEEVTVPTEDGDAATEFLQPDTPYYVAVMALMDDGTLLPVVTDPSGNAMEEVEGSPGTYQGTFTVDYSHRFPEAVVVGRLGTAETAAALADDEVIEVDPSLTLEVAVSEGELKADEKSTSEITVTVTDVNGEPVPDHEIRFLLATTSQYTGVVGGGAFAEEVGGSLKRDFRGETDLFGRATATYTAGFAAKTAIIVARDMVSNDTGAGYVKTYINATAQLELEAVQLTAGKALGYAITVTSSDEWLTADGESEARITALVTKDGIPVEGHRVGFSVAAGSGRIRIVRGETAADGRALAVYTAGTKIGVVLIRAIDHDVQGLVGTVQIELRSDAPAKIALTVEPEVLPADGSSTAQVAVVVTDINDNPNEGVEVEYLVAIGSGRIRSIDGITNRRGESSAEYVAGRLPGRVSIEVTVRSTVPTEEELLAARDLATAVTDYDFF